MSRALLALVLIVLTATLATGCGSGSRDSPRTAGGAPSTSTAPAVEGGRDRGVDKVLVFIIENHAFNEMRAEMPYVSGLADTYGYAGSYFALEHPSLPNYLAIAGGDTFGVADDDPPAVHPVHGESVFGAALDAGSTAKVYADAMERPCQDEDSGTYAVKHNPWPYFVDERDACTQGDVPITDLATDVDRGELPSVGLVVPDMCHNAHDCPLEEADGWLQEQVDEVLQGPDWESGRLAVVITADEDDDTQSNQVLTVVAHPSLHHVVVDDGLTHYSLAHSLADVAGVAPLRNAAGAVPLLAAFGLIPR